MAYETRQTPTEVRRRALEYVRMTPKRVAFKEDMLRFDPRSPAMTEKVCFSAAQRVPFFNLI